MKLFSSIFVFALVSSCCYGALVLTYNEETLLFHKYLDDFGIAPTEDFLARKQIFIENYKMVQNHNLRFDQGLETYTMAINKFSAYTYEELDEMLGFDLDMNSTMDYESIEDDTLMELIDIVDLPAQFDWRQKGAVREVQNQGACGSCWAFSAIAAIEGQLSIKFNSHEKLSEQEVVGCHAGSCRGGHVQMVYDHSQKHNGVASEINNPYNPNDKIQPDQKGCKPNTPRVPHSKVVKHFNVPEDENEIKKYLVEHGPVATAFAVTRNFYSYKGQIYSDPHGECNNKQVNHGVLIVGYGSENGHDYWIVKNSWSKTWGESGYFKMQRGKNLCKFGSYSSVPILDGTSQQTNMMKRFLSELFGLKN